jgi:uncharacterized glyoxalase superfamily protein PhnB
LFYDDLPRAVDFLKQAFGLEERRVERNDTGDVQHAQLGLGTAVVMLGPTGSWSGYRPRKSPQELGGLNAGVYLFVDAADEHANRARAAGAKISMEPADMPWGDRLYCAEDPEGQFSMFASRSA